MGIEEVKETIEHAQHTGQKGIGLTAAIVAVLLAMVSMLGHRAHTEEVKLQTKVNDGWAFYQAKHQRAHDYGKYAENEVLAHQDEVALKDLKISIAEECGEPAAANCTSPVVKNSRVLKQFIQVSSAPGTGEHPPQPPAKGAHEDQSSDHGKAGKEPVARKEGAVEIQERNRELERETELMTAKANFYDVGELFLAISIVLCSISLLAGAKLYWQLSFVSTVLGIGVAAWGWFLR